MAEGNFRKIKQALLSFPRKLQQSFSYVSLPMVTVCPHTSTTSLVTNSAFQHMRCLQPKRSMPSLCSEARANNDVALHSEPDMADKLAGMTEFGRLMLKAWRNQRVQCKELAKTTEEKKAETLQLSRELQSAVADYEEECKRRVELTEQLEQFIGKLHKARATFEQQYENFYTLLDKTEEAEAELQSITEEHYNFEILHDYCIKDLLHSSDNAVAAQHDANAMAAHRRRLLIANQQLNYELIDVTDIYGVNKKLLGYYDRKLQFELELKKKLELELLMCQCEEVELQALQQNSIEPADMDEDCVIAEDEPRAVENFAVAAAATKTSAGHATFLDCCKVCLGIVASDVLNLMYLELQ